MNSFRGWKMIRIKSTRLRAEDRWTLNPGAFTSPNDMWRVSESSKGRPGAVLTRASFPPHFFLYRKSK